MTPGTIFISHRSEYASQVRELKDVIQNNSNGRLKVFISEDIPRGDNWRQSLEKALRDSDTLFLVYGSPYEDWSWCFYEAGYFGGQPAAEGRTTYCIIREGTDVPGPLSHLQMVNNSDKLIDDIGRIFQRNQIAYDAVRLRAAIGKVCERLYGKLDRFEGFSRLHLVAPNADFAKDRRIPPNAMLSGDKGILKGFFGLAKERIPWHEIADSLKSLRTDTDRLFFSKWLQETETIVLNARDGKMDAPQTILVARDGAQRCRLLLYEARTQGDGNYWCEFLAIDEVGGPPIGLPNELISLLTSVRMGFRFRYEFISKFQELVVTPRTRKARVEEIRRTLFNLLTEADARGNFKEEDFLDAFENDERARMKSLIGYWPAIKSALDHSLGLSEDFQTVAKGLEGRKRAEFARAIEAVDLLNLEFLSRCCNRVSTRMLLSKEQSEKNAIRLAEIVAALQGEEEHQEDEQQPLPTADTAQPAQVAMAGG